MHAVGFVWWLAQGGDKSARGRIDGDYNDGICGKNKALLCRALLCGAVPPIQRDELVYNVDGFTLA